MASDQFSIDNPKIGRSSRTLSADNLAVRPDGSPDDPDRVETGPTALAFAEWRCAGITAPNLQRMRQTRLDRTVAELQKRDLGGILLFDPLNIRYASDTSNMQLWVAHNPSRALLVTADGHMTLWDFHGCDHLSSYLPLVKEVRHGAGFFYFLAGDKEHEIARSFAADVDSVLRERCGSNRRLAVDKIEVEGLRGLDELGLDIHSGQAVMEHARSIKSVDEINAMRCAIDTCQRGMLAMHAAAKTGIAEVELWALLHAENIKRGGEWIETRILSSGPRTNPWMQEAGPRVLKDGDLLAYDTDLVGPYGMCADLSRTLYIGESEPTTEQKRLYQIAHEHIQTNMQMLAPGVSFRELTERGQKLPDEFIAQRYGVMMHGVGLCDEWPAILYPEDFIEGAFDYELQPGMVLCVEAYIGAVGGREGVKLEDQVLVTESGFENLSTVSFEERLLAN